MTNEEICAYIKIAAKNTGLESENVERLLDEMTYLMDLYTGSEIIAKVCKMDEDKNNEA